MKKLVFILCLSIISLTRLHAQHTLTYDNNSYLDADKQPFILADTVREGNAGQDQVWDFSMLTATGEMTSYMFASGNHPESSLYPEANMVLREKNMDYFFKVGPSGMAEYGHSTEAFKVIYDAPIVKFPFPFTYGSAINGIFSGKQIINNQTTAVTGTYSTLADGYGTLILPGNIRIPNVLRVKFVRQSNNSQSAAIAYRWYAQNADPVVRYPLLTIIVIQTGSKVRVQTVAYYAYAYQYAQNQANNYKPEVPGEYLSDVAEKFSIKISPNPFVDKAQIEYSLPEESTVSIQIFDNTGRLLEQLAEGKKPAGPHSVAFTGKGQFVYFVRIVINDNIICSKKIIQMK
ncbi:MAG: T9SS type A sorting domain-containing protein [Bacteroidales bacterium]|nr:T9SS type A sorting domain-containing protein [Bacteroidales bacterium]